MNSVRHATNQVFGENERLSGNFLFRCDLILGGTNVGFDAGRSLEIHLFTARTVSDHYVRFLCSLLGIQRPHASHRHGGVHQSLLVTLGTGTESPAFASSDHFSCERLFRFPV